MALTLPTFTIDNPQREARLLNAFKPTPTSTMAEARTEYIQWLERVLVSEVVRREREQTILQATVGLQDATGLLSP